MDLRARGGGSLARHGAPHDSASVAAPIWRHRDVRVVLPAAAASVAGDAVALVALTLRVHDADHGPYAVAGLMACMVAPTVLLMGLAGEIADRWGSRPVLLVGGVVQVGACLGLAVTHGLEATYLLLVVLQTGYAVTNPVWSALVPAIVGEVAAARVVATQQALCAVAAPVGAAVGGVLVQLRGDALAILVDAASFAALLLAAAVLRTSRTPDTDALPPPRGAAARWMRALLPRRALGQLRSDAVMWLLFLGLLPVVVFGEAANVVEVFLVRDDLGGTAAQFGLVTVATGAGRVVGSALASRLRADSVRVWAVPVGVATIGAALLLQGLAPALVLFLLLGSVGGLGEGVSNSTLFGLLVARTSPAHRGKVLALVNGLARLAGVLSLGLGGVLGSLLGPRTTFVVGGALTLALGAALALRLSAALTGRAARGYRRGNPPPGAGGSAMTGP